MSLLKNCVCKLLDSRVPLVTGVRALSATASSRASPTVSQQKQIEDALYKSVNMEMCSHDKAVLQSYCTVLTTAAKHLDISTGDVFMTRKPSKHRLTLLKSVHIYKKHRVQYEIRTHRASLDLKRLTGSTADTYLEYVQRFLPEGISMKVTKVALEQLPEYLKPPNKQESS